MKIGVTGTRNGMTFHQMTAVTRELRQRLQCAPNWNDAELHHGDCQGVDVHVAAIAQGLGYVTVAHPPTNDYHRAFHNSTHVLPPQHYLDRNKSIVDTVDVLLVVPLTPEERQRSGTWFTYRYANRVGRDVVVFLPDGRISRELRKVSDYR